MWSAIWTFGQSIAAVGGGRTSGQTSYAHYRDGGNAIGAAATYASFRAATAFFRSDKGTATATFWRARKGIAYLANGTLPRYAY